MKDRIELLIKLGLSEKQATDFVENIANEAYSDGYVEGMTDEPAIIGESLGKSGMDFFEWWNIKMKNENKPLSYSDIALHMLVKDELGRIGKVIINDDIDNIKISFSKDHCEYFSLRSDNNDGLSKLYKA
jgi:hypothetical protein